MMKTEHYCYRVIWSEDDQEYVGLCAEFPSLSHLDRTPEAALKGIMALVRTVVEEMESQGETPPEPLATRTYSGRFQIRIPPELHRKLAIAAAETKVSLNRYVAMKLSEHLND